MQRGGCDCQHGRGRGVGHIGRDGGCLLDGDGEEGRADEVGRGGGGRGGSQQGDSFCASETSVSVNQREEDGAKRTVQNALCERVAQITGSEGAIQQDRSELAIRSLAPLNRRLPSRPALFARSSRPMTVPQSCARLVASLAPMPSRALSRPVSSPLLRVARRSPRPSLLSHLSHPPPPLPHPPTPSPSPQHSPESPYPPQSHSNQAG